MTKRIISIFTAAIILLCATSCTAKFKGASGDANNYRNVYEVFVYSFCDSNGDGIGDLNGVTSKLDYIKDLGYDAIWLMPIMPSETYHKYDVDDYYSIDSAYGTMDDFDNLIKQCDKRGIKVIIEIMMNHTSDTNKWFTEACDALSKGTTSKYTDYYNFYKNDQKPNNITTYEVPDSDYCYEGDFWEGMPDLNFDCQDLRKDFEDIAKFWIEKGVSGFRLDAAMHVYHESEKNYELFKWYTDYCKSINPNFYVIGEVWSNGDVIPSYYKGGFDTLFNFNFGTDTGEIAYKVANGYGSIFAKNLEEWETKIKQNNPNAIDGVFLTNHDNDRIASKLKSDPVLLRAMASVYMTMPGTVFTYYGEEIGMTGAGKDENKRGAMYWSATDKAGTCNGPNGCEPMGTEVTPVDEQLGDDSSLLSFYKKLLAVRNKYPQLVKGEIKAVDCGDDEICGYTSSYDGKTIYVIHNFSSKEKTVDSPASKLAESISCDGGEIKLDGGKLTLPPYGSAILEK